MQFEVIVENEEALKKCKKFVTGFHGLGEVGFITVRHLVEELKCERVAIISSSAAPPFVSIEKGRLKLPFELYVHQDIAIFIPHLQHYRHVQIEFSEHLSNWIIQQGFEVGYFIGGVDVRLQTGDENVRYIPTREYIAQKKELDAPFLEDELFVAGPLAVMLGLLDLNQFPAIGILTYADRSHPDTSSAAKAVTKLAQILDIKVEVSSLLEDKQEIEEKLLQKLAAAQEEEKSDQPAQLYT
ncbi:MAG: proteasome assembly chaperone family protein [Promethearchaeota archaeon]